MVRHHILPVDTYEHDPESPDLLAPVLQGHVLGNIPNDAIATQFISGIPDLATSTALELRQQADRDALVDNLILHTSVLNDMRTSDEQNRTLFAAQVLSQSCPNSGQALQWWPHKGSVIPGEQFIQLLRKRFAIPCLLPLDEKYPCACGKRNTAVSLWADPYHGLHCKEVGRHQRQTQRHDKVQDALAAALRKVPKLEVLEVGHPNMG